MVDFERELGTLLKAPYSFIHLVTYDEARATSFVTRLGRREGREVLEWSLTRGLSGSGAAVPPGDFHALLDAIESIKEPHIFIVKDPHPFMEDPATVRRLREMEGPLAAFGKTVVTISPRRLQPGDLATDVTELHVPLPDRKGLEEISRVVFPPER